MALMTDNKQKVFEDTLKILSTNMEVINQRLAMTRPEYGLTEYIAVMQRSIESFKKQFDDVSNKISTSEVNLQQLITYGLKQNETLFKTMQQSESRIVKGVNDQLAEMQGSLKTATESMIAKLNQSGFASKMAMQAVNNLKADMQNMAGTLDADMEKAMRTSEMNIGNEMNKMENGVRSSIENFHSTIARTVSPNAAMSPGVKNELESLKSELYNLVQRYNLSMIRNIQSGTTDDIRKGIDTLKSDMHDMLDRFNKFLAVGPGKEVSAGVQNEVERFRKDLYSVIENYNNSVQKSMKSSQPQSALLTEVKAVNIKLNILTNILEDLIKTHQDFVRYLQTDKRFGDYKEQLEKLRQT